MCLSKTQNIKGENHVYLWITCNVFRKCKVSHWFENWKRRMTALIGRRLVSYFGNSYFTAIRNIHVYQVILLFLFFFVLFSWWWHIIYLSMDMDQFNLNIINIHLTCLPCTYTEIWNIFPYFNSKTNFSCFFNT